jgi:hypothetical protein
VNLTVERWYPIAGGLVAGATLGYAAPEICFRNPDQLLDGSLEVGGILAGFIMTAKSILVAAPDSAIKRIADTGAVGMLKQYMMSAVYYSLGMVAFSAVLLGASERFTTGDMSRWTMPAWAALAVTTFFATFRVAHLFGPTFADRADVPASDSSED